MAVDNCKHCEILDNLMFYDIESESYFTCSDCACSKCEYLHNCDGQCMEGDRTQ